MKLISITTFLLSLFISAVSAGNIATTSVLSSGNWYKISVSQSGIHKIDYNLLKSIGINPDNVDPRNIRIYGNGGGVLPELNSASRHDDLVENPVMVVGEGDGRFDSGDFILFYGEGPSLWAFDPSSKQYEYEANCYTDVNTYFITADLGTGKRVANLSFTGTANYTTSTFDEIQQHEVDTKNFGSTGREWYGEFFNFSIPSRSISFNLPNVVTSEPVHVSMEFAAKSLTATSSVSLKANGQTLQNISIGTTGSSYTAPFANLGIAEGGINLSGPSLTVDVNFSNPSSAAEGYLNYIKVHGRRNLVYSGNTFNFRDGRTVGFGNITEYTVQSSSGSAYIWDVTDPVNAQNQTYANSGGQLKFTANSQGLREYVIFEIGGAFPAPGVVGKVANQNLHGLGQPNMLVIVTPALRSEADRFAQYRSAKSGIYVQVVSLPEIYNEFSSGRTDLSAIRDFVRMFYVRANGNPADKPQYLLLFGNGTYDFKGIEHSVETVIPTYQTPSSLEAVNSFAADDYFALLDDIEGSLVTPNHSLDVAIGRFPVRNLEQAKIMVDKVIHYESLTTFGSWRNGITFIGDDGDGNTHLSHAEGHANFLAANYPVYNIDKYYLDAYKLVSTPAGLRYPGVNDAINAKMFNGCLMMNYTGHGGTNGWSHERVLTIDDIRSWENYNAMPLFVTATCEFTRYDDPSRISAGEELVLNAKGGAIASVSTSRLVYAHANERTNRNFLSKVFEPYNGRMPTIGEVVMLTKNATASSNDVVNDRKFGLYGDPSLTLAYPKSNVVTTAVDEQPVGGSDTLKALQQVTLSGEVRNWDGSLMNDFNGVVYPTIFDKPVSYETLGNASGSSKTSFQVQKNIIFRGKASVKNGKFTYTFIVPKDIAYNYGLGKVSYYADNGQFDAHGYQDDLYIGGTSNDYVADSKGPDVEVFMNDEKFRSGGITDANPVLLVKLYDASGINTVGNGIGHDLVAVMNLDTRNTYVLNDFYESDTDDFRSGSARYPLFNLPDGRYKVVAKAWDVHNNSAEANTEFVVSSNPCITLQDVFNYPNPFNYSTKFQFEHNKPGELLFVDLKIFDYSGRLVKALTKTIDSPGFRIDDLEWDGQTDNGMNLSNGTYVYRLEIRTEDCSPVHQTEKLVILR
ncbi:type IX secretion system sortase PorU [soil metagenome]